MLSPNYFTAFFSVQIEMKPDFYSSNMLNILRMSLRVSLLETLLVINSKNYWKSRWLVLFSYSSCNILYKTCCCGQSPSESREVNRSKQILFLPTVLTNPVPSVSKISKTSLISSTQLLETPDLSQLCGSKLDLASLLACELFISNLFLVQQLNIISMFNFISQVQSHISIDCIKACPYQPNLFAFAYYQTNPTTLGAIAVAKINEAADLSSIKTVECPPLLHIVWTRNLQDQNIYIIAASSRNNEVFFYFYNSQNGQLTLASTLVVGQVFCLYLDIVNLENGYHLTVSTNESTVTSFILDINLVLQKKVYSKHQYAVWACRVSPVQKQMFVCGDEVDTIYMYAQGNLIAKNNTSHKGGICDLTFDNQFTLYSGGFDGIVCTFDTRKLQQHVYRHEWGGTIWRVVPNKSQILLCNSSEKKFQIVNEQLSTQKWNSGNSHQSLAYAADWGQNILLTASFYDKKLSIWQRSKE